jgi:hypothetical protein
VLRPRGPLVERSHPGDPSRTLGRPLPPRHSEDNPR